MIKKTITYEDRTGQMVTEDFLFHLTKSDIQDMHNEHDGDMSVYIRGIVDSGKENALFNAMQDIAIRAYGHISEDRKSFVKSPEMTARFAASPACIALMDELSQKNHSATLFVCGILEHFDEIDAVL